MFQAYGLYTHIRANRMRSIILLIGFVALLHALMFAFALLYESIYGWPGAMDAASIIARALDDVWRGWPVAMAAAALWFLIAFIFHQHMIDAATGAGDVTRGEAPRLYNLLENLCISRGIPVPGLKIIDDDALNAYASGIREGRYCITVTRGLLNDLTAAEIEAVLAHELTHIRNRDVQLLVIAVIFAGVFAFAADLVFRNWRFPFGYGPRPSGDRDRGGSGLAILLALAIVALSFGLSVLMRFAISRSREFLADAGSVELTKNPDAMISALRRIEAHAAMPQIPSRMGAFFIEDPALSRETGWLATHPSIKDRIEALIRYGGGRDVTFEGPWNAPASPSAAQKPSFLPQNGRSPLGPRGPWG
jgi:heat shock protein HtpX